MTVYGKAIAAIALSIGVLWAGECLGLFINNDDVDSAFSKIVQVTLRYMVLTVAEMVTLALLNKGGA